MFDPFFSSANKRYYVERPDVGAYLKKMFALPLAEQRKAVFDIERRKSLGEHTNGLEVSFVKTFRFRNAVRARAIKRFSKRKPPTLVWGGYNTGPR